MLAKSIFEQKLKCEHLVRCQNIHICCVDKANIWWDDKKWFYQEMWKEIYLMCQQNICRDHKDIFVVSTLNKGWGTGISWMWVWSDDVTTTAPKSAKSPKSPMFLSTNHQNLPDPPFYLLVLLSVGWKPESLNTCSVVAVILFSKHWPFQ